MAELSLQQEGLQDLISTLKDGRGAVKVMEWHSKMDALRLEELRQRRNNTKLHQQVSCGPCSHHWSAFSSGMTKGELRALVK